MTKTRAVKGAAAAEASGTAAPAVAAPEAAGAGEGGGPARADVRLHMPEPPQGLSPASQKRLQAVQGRTRAAAAAKSELPAADKQVGAARQSVTPPEAERAAAAQAELIEQVKAAPSPEIVKLCERIRTVIRERRPVDADALEAADPEKEANAAGGELNSAVTGETQKVQDNYGAVNDNPAAPPAPKAPDLPPPPEAKPTAPVDAGAARPDPVPAENVSLDQDAEAARQKIRDAGMETPAAGLVKSGPIAEARSAQGELDKTAEEGPAAVLAKQEQALGRAETEMGALAAEALGALNASRQGAVKGTGARQKGMVGSEESMRLAAGEQAKAVFAKAQSSVQALLKNLPAKAMEKWEQAKKLLVIRFKADLKVVQDRVDERHSGFGGGLVAWWDDKVGLPDWATEGYNRAENNFADGVIEKLLAISSEVNSIIQACDEIIANARKRIDEIFDALPESLRGWADQEKGKFSQQLDQLHDQAMAVRDGFNKDLKRQASEAVNEVRTEIAELRKKAGGLIGRIADWIQRFRENPAKVLLEALLELLGIPPAAFWAVVAKIKKAVKDIADDPLGFGDNLLKGLGQGFNQFFDNFGTHMFKGFLTWLIGDLKGVQVPKDFSLKSIATFFLQLMGITWPNIRKILVDKIGAKNVALIEKAYSFISMLIEQGPEGIYEMIKEKLNPQALVDQVIQMAVDYMVEAIAKAAAARLLLLFNPVGAIIQALEAIYRVLKWVFQNAARIFRLVETVVDGITDIIAGNVAGFAKSVENALGMLIAPVISFIADYLGFGDLPRTVAKKVESMRAWVLGIIEQAVDWIIAKGKAALAAVGIGKKEEKGGAALGEVGEQVPFAAGGESHMLWIEKRGSNAVVMVASVKQDLEAFLNGERVKAAVEAQPKGELAGLVASAKKDLQKVDLDAEKVLKEAEKIRSEQAAAAGGASKINEHNEAVKAEERALAEKVARIFEFTIVAEPIAGKHPVTREKGPPGESHHVPAKGLAFAIVEFLQEVVTSLSGEEWKEDPAAVKAAAIFGGRIKEVATDQEGTGLSAILITQETHRGEHAGVHRSASIPVIHALLANPAYAKFAVCKVATLKKAKDFGLSSVSVNPKGAGWRGFLADLRQQLKPGSLPTDPVKPRGSDTAADIVLREAKADFLAAEDSRAYLNERVVEPCNAILAAGPLQAYEIGHGVVAEAMKRNFDGTPQGQQKALATLRKVYRTTWKPFTKKLPFIGK